MKHKGPNILLITSDQQHWNTLGCFNSEIKTPNLDRLANQGVLFRRAYCVNPTCTPTRASMITGKYPSQHGAWSLGTKLPESERTVGEDFLQAGYRTALVGKAHFQPLRGTDEFPSLEAYPILQDFQFWGEFDAPFYGFEQVELARNHTDEAHVGQHYALWMEEKGCTNWRDYFRPPTGNNERQKRKWLIPEEYHYDTWIAERTNALMEEYYRNGDNFFLWASFFDPHPKYLVPEPWDTMYDPEKLTVPSIPEFMQGKSLLPILGGQTEPDYHKEHVICEYNDALQMPDATHGTMYFDGRYKSIVYHGHNIGEIYDLESDPGEFHNLWHKLDCQDLRESLLIKHFDAIMATSNAGIMRTGRY